MTQRTVVGWTFATFALVQGLLAYRRLARRVRTQARTDPEGGGGAGRTASAILGRKRIVAFDSGALIALSREDVSAAALVKKLRQFGATLHHQPTAGDAVWLEHCAALW
jgi:hypothetical protein